MTWQLSSSSLVRIGRLHSQTRNALNVTHRRLAHMGTGVPQKTRGAIVHCCIWRCPEMLAHARMVRLHCFLQLLRFLQQLVETARLAGTFDDWDVDHSCWIRCGNLITQDPSGCRHTGHKRKTQHLLSQQCQTAPSLILAAEIGLTTVRLTLVSEVL